MINSLDLETLMKVIPRCCFVGMHNRSLRDAGANERRSLAFRTENCRDGVAAALPNYDNNLALAILVPRRGTITPMCFDIGGDDVGAEMMSEESHFKGVRGERPGRSYSS